ncbi:MAG: 4-hydroxy-tetrahydrodipicolinate reductase [Acidiferrobacterales bacterium]
MLRVAVTGAAGRMGRTVIKVATEAPDLTVSLALEQSDHPLLGADAGELAAVGPLGVPVATDPNSADYDVLIDFSHPTATVDYVKACQRSGRRMVIGTTGLEGAGRQRIADAAAQIAVVFAPNMSAGVNLCLRLIDLAARVLGDDFDVEITEAHHRHKRDAPSGTALRMGEVVAQALGRTLDDCAVYSRAGMSDERPRGQIGFNALRAGEIVGDHTVLFAGSGERVEISHRAESRLTFANGALRATRWVVKQDKGLFDMQDVLGLR